MATLKITIAPKNKTTMTQPKQVYSIQVSDLTKANTFKIHDDRPAGPEIEIGQCNRLTTQLSAPWWKFWAPTPPMCLRVSYNDMYTMKQTVNGDTMSLHFTLTELASGTFTLCCAIHAFPVPEKIQTVQVCIH